MERTTWPGWECVRLIGTGSFGKVYEIRRTEYGREFKAALKVITIPPDDVSLQQVYNEGMGEQDATEYFRCYVEDIAAEFAMMAELKGHTNIVSYEDHMVKERENQFGWDILIRMELLTPLVDWVQIRPMTEKDVIRLGIDMCRALGVCHDMNILHRDIKPENIFVNRTGDYKLGDFGIAKQTAHTLSSLSQKGTYTYMAPEVYFGKPYGKTADLYSLGTVLYRYLNGQRTPFLPQGTIRYTDREEALRRRMKGEPIPEPAHGSAMLRETVLKAIAFNAADRYQTAEEMREALEACLRYCREHGDSMAESKAPEQAQSALTEDADATVMQKDRSVLPFDAPQENAEEDPDTTCIPEQEDSAPKPAEIVENLLSSSRPVDLPPYEKSAQSAEQPAQEPEIPPEAQPADETPEPVSEPAEPQSPRKKLLLPAAIGGAVLLVGLVIAGIALHSRSKPVTVSSTGTDSAPVSEAESQQNDASSDVSSSRAEASSSKASSSSEAKSESSAQQSKADGLRTDDLCGIRLLVFVSGDKASGAVGTLGGGDVRDGLKWELIPEDGKLRDTGYDADGQEEIRVSDAGIPNHYYVDYIRKEPLFGGGAQSPEIWVTVDDMSAQIADVSFLGADGGTVEFELGSERTETGSDGAKTFFMVLQKRF